MLNQLPLALQLTAVIKKFLTSLFLCSPASQWRGKGSSKVQSWLKNLYQQMVLFYICAPIFICSLPDYQEERRKDLWKIVGDLPTASCDSLPRPLSLSLVVFVEGTSLWPQVWLFWCPFTNFYVPYGEKRTFFRFPCIPFCNLWGFFGKDLFKLITGLWECSEKVRLES